MGIVRNAAPFTHEPLGRDRHEIRLLHVFGSAWSLGGAVLCKIQHAVLGDCENYEALKCRWGDENDKKNIRCNGKTFALTRNLENALRALRYFYRTRVLWVDAVCINQKNEKEKGKQVGMMRDIYLQAEGVVAWVGEEDPKDKAALNVGKFLKKIESKDILSYKELETWCALTTFIQRPNFSRVWIVQELAVAKKLTFYCGRYEMEWDTLRRGLFMFLDRMGLHLNTLKEDVSLERDFTFVSIRNLITEHSEEHKEQRGRFHPFPLSRIDDDRTPKVVRAGDLLHFLKGTRPFGARNPRDHIFALRGLVRSEDREKIEINYSQPYTDVFREFARVMIVKHGNLDVLSQAGSHKLDSTDEKPNYSLPSWVPDWTRQMKRYPLRAGAYSASGTLKKGGSMRLKSMEQEEFQEVLTLRRKVVDRIDILSPCFIVPNTPLLKNLEPRKRQLFYVAIKAGKNPFNPVEAISNILQSRTLRIKPELEYKGDQAARDCKLAYASRSGGWEVTYMQTLIGNLPFKQLKPFHEALVHDCFLIWRERLSEDPITSDGIFSKGYWTGKAKTGEELINLNPKLIELFSQYGQHSRRSRQRLREEKKGKEQDDSSTKPLLDPRVVRSDDHSNLKAMHDAASVKLYYARMFSGEWNAWLTIDAFAGRGMDTWVGCHLRQKKMMLSVCWKADVCRIYFVRRMVKNDHRPPIPFPPRNIDLSGRRIFMV